MAALSPVRWRWLLRHGGALPRRIHCPCVRMHRIAPKPQLRQYDVNRVGARPFHFCISALQMHSFIPPETPKIGEEPLDPEELAKDDLDSLHADIKHEFVTFNPELKTLGDYYFDGSGKSIRPTVVILMARALNFHIHKSPKSITAKQRQVAMISEMIHTASIIHDDVIDNSDRRRGMQSVNLLWGQRKAILGGDYILSIATKLLASLENTDVTSVITQIILDLVQGEFMQLGSRENENERFSHYLLKTYKKTASLLANTCKAVAILGMADASTQEIAYQYGRNLGIAFQLIDDALDFNSNQETLGKPAAADLNMGLATAPVLFASDQYPELHEMIMRRFSQPGDVKRAMEAVLKSDGLKNTYFLAHKHCLEAIRCINQVSSSPEQKALIIMTEKILNR